MFKQIWNRIKEHVREALNSRLFVLIFVFCILFTILIGRLFYLQIVKGNYYLNNYELQIRKTRTIPGTRGNIYDRNGNLLAYNDRSYCGPSRTYFCNNPNKSASCHDIHIFFNAMSTSFIDGKCTKPVS